VHAARQGETPESRDWYAHRTLEHGWSRQVLIMQIETDVRGRTGSAVTNFGEPSDPRPLKAFEVGAQSARVSLEDGLITEPMHLKRHDLRHTRK
jgi:predicted nuclease of restriction endonuclease-like (RecB) superfamily